MNKRMLWSKISPGSSGVCQVTPLGLKCITGSWEEIDRNGQSLITAQIQTLHIGLGHSVSKWLCDIRWVFRACGQTAVAKPGPEPLSRLSWCSTSSDMDACQSLCRDVNKGNKEIMAKVLSFIHHSVVTQCHTAVFFLWETGLDLLGGEEKQEKQKAWLPLETQFKCAGFHIPIRFSSSDHMA